MANSAYHRRDEYSTMLCARHKLGLKEVAEGEDNDAFWTRIGSAWPHKDGKGLNLVLSALPINGRFVLREYTPEDEKKDVEKKVAKFRKKRDLGRHATDTHSNGSRSNARALFVAKTSPVWWKRHDIRSSAHPALNVPVCGEVAACVATGLVWAVENMASEAGYIGSAPKSARQLPCSPESFHSLEPLRGEQCTCAPRSSRNGAVRSSAKL
jgi:hypothetical protein